MNREFYADRPNEKWLTDVTAFKYYDGPVIKKLYLSAFLDLYDRRIVAYKPVVLGYLIYQTVSGKLIFGLAYLRHPIFQSVTGKLKWEPYQTDGSSLKVLAFT